MTKKNVNRLLKAARRELEEYLQYLKNNQRKEQEELDED